jgi:hypothetical protein
MPPEKLVSIDAEALSTLVEAASAFADDLQQLEEEAGGDDDGGECLREYQRRRAEIEAAIEAATEATPATATKN